MQKLFLLLLGLCLPLWPTVAQNRSVAKPTSKTAGDLKGLVLVIGNWTYPDSPLKNPENDAKDMAELFRQLGYEVMYYENLSKLGMEEAHSEFIGRLAKSKVGIFYFAGHGFRGNDNTNYLNSIELRRTQTEALSRDKSLSMDIVMQDMKNTNPDGTNILFIDACRTYQGRSWGRNGNNQGLGKVNAPRGTLAFFAASVGQEASENTGQRNGLFTQELKKQLTQPNLELTEVLQNTAKAVFTQNRSQEPYWEGNFYEKFYFRPNTPVVTVTPAANPPAANPPTAPAITAAQLYQQGKTLYDAQKYTEALPLLKQAAEMGNADGQYLLSKMYRWGNEIQVNLSESFFWCNKAALQNHLEAQYSLGVKYERGTGVLQNYHEAGRWYRKAAEQNDPDGQNNLGYLYMTGLLEVNYSEAMRLFRLAAEKNHSLAQLNLGYMYEKGYGVKQDYVEAIKWYTKSAEQGDDGGQRNLAIMYRYGYGVKKDYKMAVEWYRKSAQQGNADAQQQLKSLGETW